MTTATRKRTDPLAELEARERAHAEAKAHASELGSEFGAVSRQLQGLQDQRARLIHPVVGDPSLVDHHGAPSPDVKDNPGRRRRRPDRRPGGRGGPARPDAARPPARAIGEAGRRRLHRLSP